MMKVIASMAGEKAVSKAMQILREGGTALDAVEAGTKVIEDDPQEHGVGYSGLPNLLGFVELDASIMDGRTLRAGSVAGVRYHKNPISIARKVMEMTPHAMLVGDGADLFADIMGFERTELLTEDSRRMYRDWITQRGLTESEFNILDRAMFDWYNKYVMETERHGTVGVIALDGKGDLAVAVSTSGLEWKLPGRVGDSPIIGAGNYADNRYGAAACTGRGELAIRVCLAKTVVGYMKAGAPVQEACDLGIQEILRLEDPIGTLLRVNVIAMDPIGNVGATCSKGPYTFYYQDEAMPNPLPMQSHRID
jgi:beta-aspartyl-peptidase (threonine type)